MMQGKGALHRINMISGETLTYLEACHHATTAHGPRSKPEGIKTGETVTLSRKQIYKVIAQNMGCFPVTAS